ncbi:MAG: UDP-N-acetylmuramate dehydrogenase, partial [Chloroflexota bacterium]
AWGGSVSERLRYAEMLRPDGTTVVLGKDEMAYRYRGSRLKKAPGEVVAQAGDVVLRASFALRPGDAVALQEKIAQYRRERLERQPQQASAGSVFKNPPGDHAGRLIEAAGLKGTRRGQAQVSEKHGNFIVNLGGATAPDVLALINLARERVKATTGVELELEVQLVGQW